jgi:DNA invertase Pin-like site-specific DNA recombinase
MKQNKNQSVYAIIYGRVNRGEKILENQTQACVQYAKNRGFSVGAHHSEICSGLKNRDEESTLYKIKRQLKFQSKSKFVLVAMDISRISRNVKIAIEYINELASIGVDVEFVNNCNVGKNALSVISYSRVSSNKKSTHRSIKEQRRNGRKFLNKNNN